MSEFYDYNFLCHYGIKGMKWGIRRYQNPDGSLTTAGKERYRWGPAEANKKQQATSVKEFGKDSVKDILIDKKKVAKYAEKTQRIISSAHLKTAETKAAASEKRSINDNRKMLGLKELELKKPISPWAKPFRDNPNLEKAYDNMTSAKAKYEKAVMMPHKYDIKTAKQEYMTAYKNYTGEYSKGSSFLSGVAKATKPLTDVLADGYTSFPVESVFKGYSSDDDKKKRKHK